MTTKATKATKAAVAADVRAAAGFNAAQDIEDRMADMMEQAAPRRTHSEGCAYHFGGDCTCGLFVDDGEDFGAE